MTGARFQTRGFTLTESAALLVIATLAAAAIVPCLAAAQTNAQSSVAYANLKLLVRGQVDFATAHDQLLPGPHSSGWECRVTYGQSVVGNTTPSTPTQSQDWISPCLGDELGFSANRAERLWQIFEFLADPRAIRHNDAIYAAGGAPDLNDFVQIMETRGYLQLSYLAPAPFYLVPPMSTWAPDPNLYDRAIHGFRDPATVPIDYIPRLDRIGPPAGKIAVAEGTRYLALGGLMGGGTTLDFDASSDPSPYANFLTGTPIFDKSVAYGRATLPIQHDAENVRLSMRYPTLDSAFGRGMHVGRFDGSVGFITAEQAWGDASAWYPTGSVFTGNHATPESEALYDVGAVLP